MMSFPKFKYHPDPIATGSIVKSSNICECCDTDRGYIYTGPVYAIEQYAESICPWCIADGSAHQKLDVVFTDVQAIGGYGTWESVSDAVIDEIARRTPGFIGWQQEQWWTHCGDAGQFLGRAGKQELVALGIQAIKVIQDSIQLEGSDWEDFFNGLDKDGSPTAYFFRCQKCGTMGGYQDCD